ncbi:HAD-IIA family hydrolase [Acidiferrimicrobium sp. IK]|uniref:HAD-IIA family hydrolase n=1 Tax=Acidiferrimicrobium sp. IK TaxID=2871700 RepID=UPI0021CAF520|nr:HAD-IIA family hydrolase [Acidiferrimicrobium sp. IK]MCU4184746.1 HAD-IIA family hydrolase [Acidiferrimicrobium sp. IK]
MLWVLDLDGVVWLAGRPIPGSPEAVARIRDAGHRVAFVTNNAGPTIGEHADALRRAGVDARPDEVVSSAQAAASLLEPGTTAAAVGGPGVSEALAERGVAVVHPGSGPDAVVVGRAPVLDYDELAAASSAIRGGARFVATNTDATFPTPDGLLPGAGAVIAFLTVSSGVQPTVAGKPHQAVADLVRDRFGPVGIMVGDRLDTDGRFAALIAAPFGLVLTGVTRPDEVPTDPAPAVVGDDLSALTDAVLAGCLQ